MQYRILGRTGMRVSVIGLGSWQFGGEWGRVFSQDEVDAILDKAAEMGITLIDTAECYGDHTAEKLIGDYLSRRDRSRWIVATKFGHRFNKFMDRADVFSVEDVRAQLETSLRALRLGTIDLYQFHSGSDAHCLNGELWAMIDAQKRAGTIRHTGISILAKGSETQAREALRLGAEVLQVKYNRLDRLPERIYFPHARRDNLGVIGRVPLASGLLTGKYRAGDTFPANDVRVTFDAERMRKDLAEAEQIRATEIPPGVSPAHWAIAWCLRDPVVSTTIVGCKDPAQVEANAAAVNLLPADGR